MLGSVMFVVTIVSILCFGNLGFAEEKVASPEYAQRGWSTVALGGVLPTAEQLRRMQKGDYILRAVDNQLIELPAQKTELPVDPCGHVQRLALFVGPNETVYATQCSLISKSTDGGKTWMHLRRETNDGEVPDNHFMDIRVLSDGTWIRGRATQSPRSQVDVGEGEVVLSISTDEGKSWREISRIGNDLGTEDLRLGGIEVLRNGTLLVPLTAVYRKEEEGGSDIDWKGVKSLFYRSTDDGTTFSRPSIIGEWGHELNVSELPSGRLLAVIRYQRPLLPSDPANILVLTGAQRHNHSFPYKHVFVADSTDGGRSWSPIRQLTTECGQCHGQGVGLSKGRVVVVYDHRYPREMAGARAVVSDDEGKTWRDEVYYLSNAQVAGFARTITLDGREMLTLTGTYSGKNLSWESATGATQFYVIRWRLAE